MDLTFRTLGAWGAGKGSNLEATEVDNNFWSLAEAIIALQNNPPEANGIASITVSGTQMTITLTDGTVMGPFTLPVLTFRWRGEFAPYTLYAVLDVITVSTGNPAVNPATVRYGIFMVQVAGMQAVFEPDAIVAEDGTPIYLQLFGSVDTLLSTLGDVALDPPGGPPLDQDALVWNAGPQKWVNQTLGDMAFQASTNVLITGGLIGGMPNPVNPGDVCTKGYVDLLPEGGSSPDATIMANISGGVQPAIPNILSHILDYTLGTTTRGTLLFRGGPGWIALAPGPAGYFLETDGPGADPFWAVGASGVTSITAGTGIDTGGGPITSTGTVALAHVADKSLLANASGSTAAPSATSLTVFLDQVLANVRGSVLVRAGSGWVALAPGTAGYFLQTQGATADPLWASPAGAGTVTSISAGTGISTGGAPITGAGTVSLAAIAASSVLANISGGSAAPVPATVSVLFDSVFGSTQGAVLYRNATTWVMLAPGTSGQILTSGGAAANPSWAAAPAGSSVASLRIVSNITGSTAAPIGNTLSDIFDAILGSSRGMLVYRGSAGWAALSPGTSGDVLTTGGTAGDPHWAATAAGASISVGDTAPSSPSVGDAWWDSLGGQLYIRYNDGTSSQWVPASNQPGPAGASANMSGMTAGQLPVAATATSVTSSIALPLAVANGGTGATTAGAALTALGAVAKAGDTMTGPLSVTGGSIVAGSATLTGIVNGTVAGAHMSVAQLSGLNTYFNGSTFVQVGAGYGGYWNYDASAGDMYLYLSTTTAIAGAAASGLTARLYLQRGGACQNTTGTWSAISDASVKSDVQPYQRGLDAIMALEPCTFRYNSRSPYGDEGITRFGLVAQQVEPHIPEVIGSYKHIPKDEAGKDMAPVELSTLDPGALIYALINAVKELSAKVAALEGKPA